MEDLKWIFSGIGVLFLSLLIGYIIKYKQNRKGKETSFRNNNGQNQRTVNQYGNKSTYVEKNEGNITIN